MSTVSGTSKPRRRGRGGCCGCLIVLLLLIVGALWLARKWAPNHLNRGLAWSRERVVQRYPVLDRWVPQPPGAHPATVFEPSVPVASAPPTPAPMATSPSPVPTPAPTVGTPEPTSLGSEKPVELVVGTGTATALGQTVQVKYSTAPPPGPEVFMVGAGEVEPALEEAVKGMKVGGKRRIGAVELELVKIL